MWPLMHVAYAQIGSVVKKLQYFQLYEMAMAHVRSYSHKKDEVSVYMKLKMEKTPKT